jgi:hypothetical protein
VWIHATRINKPLDWWKKIISEKNTKFLSRAWLPALVATSGLWLFVMELGIFGYFPGQSNPNIILKIIFILLFSTAILANFTFICAFARDIGERKLEE